MSVRHEPRRRLSTGEVRRVWSVDVKERMPNGRKIRIRRVPSVQTERAAKKLEQELREGILDGTIGPDGKEIRKEETQTLEAFSEEFVNTYAESNNKPSEVCSKKSILKHHLIPAFGKKRLDEIGPREIEAFKAMRLKAGLSAKSINNYLTVLRKLLDTAAEWKLIAIVPRVKWLKAPKPRFDFLTFEEAPGLIEAAETGWNTMVLIAVRTGLRIGELRALQWDDVDTVAGRLIVNHAAWKNIIATPKSGRKREIPLSPDALKALKAHKHLRGPFVFSNEDGKMLTENECKHPLKRACKRAGLRRVGWHVLRHTFASHLVMRGVPLKAVQELMGHATIEMTMRYADLAPEVRIDAVAKLDQRPSGLPSWGNLRATEQP